MKIKLILLIVFGMVLMSLNTKATLQNETLACFQGFNAQGQWINWVNTSNATPTNNAGNTSSNCPLGFPSCATFDGSDDYFNISTDILNTAKNLQQGGIITVFNSSNSMGEGSNVGTFISMSKPTGTPNRMSLYLTGTGNADFSVDIQDSPLTRQCYKIPVITSFLNNEFEVMFQSSGSHWSVFVNGSNQTLTDNCQTTPNNGTWYGDSPTGFDTFVIGMMLTGSSSINDFNGKMSMMLILNSSLSAEKYNETFAPSVQNCTRILGIQVNDITPPQLNFSVNVSSLQVGDVINMSGNISDDSGLSFCSFAENSTGTTRFYNYSVSGIGDKCSQNVTISQASGTYINFSLTINDTSNNKVQSSIIKIVGDTTAPTLTVCTLSSISITDATGNTINFQCNSTDNGIIQSMSFDLNGSLNATRSFSVTQSASVSSTYTIFQSQETLKAGSYSIRNVTVIDTSSNKLVNATSFDFEVTVAPSGGGGGSSAGGGGGGGGSIIPPPPQCKEHELMVSNKCVNASLFNVTLKVIGLTNIQPIVFYRTCGNFQEWRQLLKSNKILKSAEFDRKQLNTNITIMGSDALIIKKIRTSKIAERIDLGNLKMIDTTQQVARVFIALRIVSLCNPLTYLFIAIPIAIFIFRKKLKGIFKRN